MSAFGAHSLEEAVDALVLDPQGPLHQEPDRLLLEETPSAMALRPLLEVIGLGAHRLTEMAGRLGIPVTSLSRPMARLLEMDLVRREHPFGETEKSGKRSLYRIEDPFFRMWYRVVAPRRGIFAQALPETRIALWRKYQEDLAAEEWVNKWRRGKAGMRLLAQASDELTAKGVPGGLSNPGTTVHHVLFFPLPAQERVGAGTLVLGALEVMAALGG